ncbi:MAG TPA: MBL fold metallo-hydrolase [Steroidobacteraceae bacterium]|nr:MBL fold metallo-hydrolase [Steroidobacteraceae bacterium]
MSSVSRRGFLQAAAATSAGAVLCASPFESAWSREARAALAVSEIAPGLSLITGGGGNVVVLGGPDGALLVDGGNAASSAALLKLALKTAGAKQVHTLFNTHWHPDQTGSNERVGKSGARIIAQENTKLWLGRKIVTEWLPGGYGPLPKAALPNKSFYTTDSIDFGGEKLAFGHLGQAHTDGDLYVHFTRANVLAAGGVVSNAGWPLLDWQTGGWIGGLVAAYDRLLKVADDATKVVPANGTLVDRKFLQSCRDMYFQVFDRCVKQLVKGMGPEECADSQPAKEYEAQWGDSRAFVIASFKSLWGHYAPDA